MTDFSEKKDAYILSYNEIGELITGTVRFITDEHGIQPMRFTESQCVCYQKFSWLADKVNASSGTRLDFLTDAAVIKVSYHSLKGSPQNFCYFDIYCDGVMVQHCGMEDRTENPDGELFIRTDGQKHRITVYLPSLCGVVFREMKMESVSLIQPVKRAKKLLVYGDSISQGNRGHYPSLNYVNQIADRFEYELVSKAVGGDRFNGEIASQPEPVMPDHIFVAYGTNDWATKKREEFETDVRTFFAQIRTHYPRIPMTVLLPVWRGDCENETFVGSFESARDFIRNECSHYPAVHVIDGMKLMPQLSSFFADYYLHPNDIGFFMMAKGIIREMEQWMQ